MKKSLDHARYLSLPELDGLEAIRASYRQHVFPPHYHDTYLIGATEAGAEVFSARGERHVSPAGSLRLFNPGEVHTGQAPNGGTWHYRALYPSLDLMSDATRDMRRGNDGPPLFPEVVVADRWTAADVIATVDAIERPASRLERESRVIRLVAEVVRRHAAERTVDIKPGHEHAAVRRARDYIDANATRTISIHDLSDAAYLSPYHLIRVFKREVGLTPSAYQTQMRIEIAKGLLARGVPVGRVAMRCGFCDQSHLHRTFKRRVGVSPAQYLRASI